MIPIAAVALLWWASNEIAGVPGLVLTGLFLATGEALMRGAAALQRDVDRATAAQRWLNWAYADAAYRISRGRRG